MKLMILLIIFFSFWNVTYDRTSATEFRKQPHTLTKGVLCVYICINQHPHESATKSFDQQTNLTNKCLKIVNYLISFHESSSFLYFPVLSIVLSSCCLHQRLLIKVMATYLLHPLWPPIGRLSLECLCMSINSIVPLAMNLWPAARPVEISFLISDISFSSVC